MGDRQEKVFARVYPRFGTTEECPKCGTVQAEVARQFIPEKKNLVRRTNGELMTFKKFMEREGNPPPPYKVVDYDPEHLLFFCKCGFDWEEQCADGKRRGPVVLPEEKLNKNIEVDEYGFPIKEGME